MHTVIPPMEVLNIIRRINSARHRAYFVGGCVRDAILGGTPHDWDIATSAKPEQVKKVFKDFRIVDTGLKHGTVTLIGFSGEGYEVTTFRMDGEYTDGRRPNSIEFVSDLEVDMSRRDFTVNALAYHPDEGIIDYFGGIKDIENKVIRCVGNPDDRFAEDALRIMRALRFSSVLGFEIEKETAESIHKNKGLLYKVSKERIRVEFDKLLMGKGVEEILTNFSDVIVQIIPDILPCIGFEQYNPHHYLTVWDHTIKAISYAKYDLVVRLALFFHDIGKPESFTRDEVGTGHFFGHPYVSETITHRNMKRLKYDNQTISQVTKLVCLHDMEFGRTKHSIRKIISKIGYEETERLIEVKLADAKAQNNPTEKIIHLRAAYESLKEIISDEDCISLKHLAVNGKDVMKLGVPQGPRVGEILNKVFEAVLEGSLENTKECIEKYILQLV